MHTRRTSVYTLEVPGQDRAHRADIADLLTSRCPVPLAGSGTNHETTFIRFRVAGDTEALDAAEIAAQGLEYRLHTGYGINQRRVHLGSSPRQA